MCNCKKDTLSVCGFVLILVGALNWGFIGAFNVNIIEAALGSYPMIVKIVYLLVGVAAVLAVGQMVSGCSGKNEKTCGPGGCH